MFGTILQQGGLFPEAPERVWLAIGSFLMLVGTFYFMAKGWGVKDREAKEYYMITTLIPGIAAASYLSMFFGFGVTQLPVEFVTPGVEDGFLTIYWARYADWLFTTPLLLLDLALLADADRTSTIGLILVDAFMIVTGLVGALAKVYIARWVFWTMSTIALLVVLWYLYSELTARVKQMDKDTQDTFRALRNAVLVLWLVYPVLWAVGTEGAGVVPLYVETLGFMILDVLAKVGFGLILLRSRAIFPDSSAPEPSAAGEAAAGD
ncbi:rhodopsin [Halobacteriales archaeon SW_7_68_16]|nr:MAG: rhodopsin [Halobacteriales archaeon SW_7_68_16]